MLNLFANYNEQAELLYHSLQAAGYSHPTVVLEDNGFLPAKVESPYKYFVEATQRSTTGKPCFFNQVKVPALWEIKGDAKGAGVYYLDEKRANINYHYPKDRRLVESVTWLDRQGNARFVEHYNQNGWIFAKTSYNLLHEAITTAYFTQSGQEVIVENHITHDVTLNFQGKIYNFPTKLDFVLYYLNFRHFELDRIFYNSLALPFMVVLRLPQTGSDVLFWQEGLGDQVPGNMQLIFNNQARRTKKIVVTNEEVYQKLRSLVGHNQRKLIKYLPYVYQVFRHNLLRPVSFTLTNTDNLLNFEELLKAAPDITFNVAALTNMSNKLLDLLKYPNVILYPNANQARLNLLWQGADIYLDLNVGEEVNNASRKAFENNMLILGFENSVHDDKLVDPESIYATPNYKALGKKLNEIANKPNLMKDLLLKQTKAARAANISKYKNILD